MDYKKSDRGQVPSWVNQVKNTFNILIVGSGRLSNHLCHYISLLKDQKINEGLEICVFRLSRKYGLERILVDQTQVLSQSKTKQPNIIGLFELVPIEQLKTMNLVLLAVSDSAIGSFSEEFHKCEKLKNSNSHFIHFSGAEEFENLVGMHPLMSFSTRLLSLDEYKQINFITTTLDAEDAHHKLANLKRVIVAKEVFSKIFPNPIIEINSAQKTKYHAYCVFAGNFSVMLWQKFYKELNQMGIPKPAMDIYQLAISKNILENPMGALTGPLVRRDILTIKKNLSSLSDQTARDLYLNFVRSYDETLYKEIL